MLWNLFQQRRIRRNREDLRSAQLEIGTATDLIGEDLIEKVQEVDLRDGELDGKLLSLADCLSCTRSNNARRTLCIYCGEELPMSNAFDAA
jgi:hypothetical protein